MSFLSLSDLTRSLVQQREGRELRALLDAKGRELTTGRPADIRKATGGDLAPLFAIDRGLARIADQRDGLSVAEGRAAAVQQKLSVLSGIADETGLNLVGAIRRADPVSVDRYASEARADLDMLRSALNAGFGGYQLMSGAAMNRQPLAATDVVVADVRALIAAAPDAASALTAIDSYFFNPGGGFETGVYTGAATNAPPVELAEGTRLSYLPRADDPAIRTLMRGLAIAAAVSEGAPMADEAMKMALLESAGETISGAKTGIVAMSARLGIAEQQISDAEARLSGERDRLEIARSELGGVDRFAAATEFTALEQQLEAAYAVTARLSALRLTNFLR